MKNTPKRENKHQRKLLSYSGRMIAACAFPLGKRAWINPEFTGKCLLRYTAGFAVRDELFGDDGPGGKGPKN